MSHRLIRPLLLSALSLLPLTAARAAEPVKLPHLTQANSALYIANWGDRAVMRCDGASGKVLAILGTDMTPVGLAIGPDRNLYVTSLGDGSVLRFNPVTGKSLGTFIRSGSGGLSQPICMAFGPNGDLFVSNQGNCDIRRYSGKTGAPKGIFVRRGSGGMTFAGDITFGPDGNLFVTNNHADEVLRFNGRTGAPMGAFIKKGSGGLSDPQNIAFAPDGTLFVGGPAGVLEYGKTGAFKRVFAAPGAHLSNVGGLTFGPDGNLYVGDWMKSDVVRYNGKTAAFLGVFVPPSSGLMENRYILFGPKGSGGTSPVVAAALRVKRMKAEQAAEARAEASRPKLLAVGTEAPDFAAITPDGKTVHLSDYKGKPVVLDFWSTWCGPCQMAMPHLEKVYQQVKDKDVTVLGVCVWDDKASYDKWVTAKKSVYTFTTAFDPAGRDNGTSIASHLYNVSGIPTQYVIDKDGKVAASSVGYDQNGHALESALKGLGVDIVVPE